MNRRVIAEAIGGAFDGANTGLGLVMGLIAGASVSGLTKVAVPAIAAGAASMASSELVKDNENGWQEVGAMGVAWTTMAALPVGLALVTSGWLLWTLVGIWMTGLCGVMGGRGGGLVKTYLCAVVVGVVTVGAALLT